jgi:hypothetical protein
VPWWLAGRPWERDLEAAGSFSTRPFDFERVP